MQAKRQHPAIPLVRRYFSSHPSTWAREFARGYKPPQTVLSQACTGRSSNHQDVKPGDSVSAQCQTRRSLYNHVDPIALLDAMDPTERDNLIQRTEDALRMSLPETIPKQLLSFIYSDVNHGTGDQEGTPIIDIGGGDGRKVMQSWKKKDPADFKKLIYAGPDAIIVDRNEKPPILSNITECGELTRNGAAVVCNLKYMQHDLNRGLPNLPRDRLYTSVNALTQLESHVIDELRARDGFHMVPDLDVMLAQGMSDIMPDGRILTRALKRGASVKFLEYKHDLPYTLHPATFTQDYYKLVVFFSPRVLSTGELASGAIVPKHPLLSEKPLRLGVNRDMSFAGPYKLKLDGVTGLFDFEEDSITFQSANRSVTYYPGPDHSCLVRVQLLCEVVREGELTHAFPFQVVLAGRSLQGKAVEDFMRNTEFKVDGVEFHEPIFYESINEAAAALVDEPRLPRGVSADGIISVGSGRDIAAKLVETIDIKPCDPSMGVYLAGLVAPSELYYGGSKISKCVAAHEAEDHSSCPVFEHAVVQKPLKVTLVRVRERTDKTQSNSRKRLEQVMPRHRGYEEGPAPTKLVDLLSESCKSILRLHKLIN